MVPVKRLIMLKRSLTARIPIGYLLDDTAEYPENTENGMGDGIWFGIVPCDEPGGFRVT